MTSGCIPIQGAQMSIWCDMMSNLYFERKPKNKSERAVMMAQANRSTDYNHTEEWQHRQRTRCHGYECLLQHLGPYLLVSSLRGLFGIWVRIVFMSLLRGLLRGRPVAACDAVWSHGIRPRRYRRPRRRDFLSSRHTLSHTLLTTSLLHTIQHNFISLNNSRKHLRLCTRMEDTPQK